MKQFNPYDHFGFLTNRVYRLIVKHAEIDMVDHASKLPPSCIGVMAELWSRDGLSQKEIGIALIKNKSSVNKMLVALEEAGMITKKEDPNDKRGKQIFLTEKGRHFQSFVENKSLEMEKTFFTKSSKSDVEIAKKVLAELYEKLRQNNKERLLETNSNI